MKRLKVLLFGAGITVVSGFSTFVFMMSVQKEQQVLNGLYSETPVYELISVETNTSKGKAWSEALEQKQKLTLKLAEDIYGLEALVNWTSRITLYFSNLSDTLDSNGKINKSDIQDAFTSRLRLSNYLQKLKDIYAKVGVEWKDEYEVFIKKLNEYKGQYEAIADRNFGFEFAKSLEILANKMKSAKDVKHSAEIVQLYSKLKAMMENKKVLSVLKGG